MIGVKLCHNSLNCQVVYMNSPVGYTGLIAFEAGNDAGLCLSLLFG